MGRIVGIGWQDFGYIIRENLFYVDKTHFIKEWWEGRDEVTMINRPHCFGKTLTMSMVEHFFSVKYAGQADLFQGLSIWQDVKYHALQGTYPVINLSFANIKEKNYGDARKKICYLLEDEFVRNRFLLDGNLLAGQEKAFFHSITANMDDVKATLSLNYLSDYLSRYYENKVPSAHQLPLPPHS